ncbi:MAG TPA: adenylate/guanylate cyclase domain-containing protein [Candidatus Binatia bacterium]|jgi:class 3 adenylate cyclase|nr:adenylate/guanylate cyclase domain-containing protein [Candidatus Binatia bacterium]
MTLGFRLKILLALMLVVAGVTGGALLVTQASVAATYRALVDARLDGEADALAALQETRLAAVKAKCRDLAGSVRLVAAMEEHDDALLYRIALDELRDVLGPEAASGGRPAATFFRLIDGTGRVLPTTDARAGLVGGDGGAWEEPLARAAQGLATQEVGYLAPRVDGRVAFVEVILTPILDRATETVVGALAIGFPVGDGGAPRAGIRGGLWVDGHLQISSIPAALVPELSAIVVRQADGAPALDQVVDVDGEPYRVHVRPMRTAAHLPPTFHVGLHSVADAVAAEHRLRLRILGFAALALLVAFGLSGRIARGLSEPVEELVAATAQIQRGNLDVRVPTRGQDELGRLGTAFNGMAADLALKERYRSVLDLVADPSVAEQLLRGEVTLGGELRDATVLFADICGFTAMSEHMAPAEVIALLNEHMTVLTRVVHDHGGIIDKFVGDAIMAIFGVPRGGTDDASRAVAAARAMLAERDALNARTRRHITMSIGIASGAMVAGCMGSTDRLNYTVLGARVNLAARLCSEASPMTILVDDATRQALGDTARAERLPALQLRGFSTAVDAWHVER